MFEGVWQHRARPAVAAGGGWPTLDRVETGKCASLCDTYFLRTAKLHAAITAGRRPARNTVAKARQWVQHSLIAERTIAAACAERSRGRPGRRTQTCLPPCRPVDGRQAHKGPASKICAPQPWRGRGGGLRFAAARGSGENPRGGFAVYVYIYI